MKDLRRLCEFRDRLTIRNANRIFTPMGVFFKTGFIRFLSGSLIAMLVFYAGNAGADDAVRCDGKLIMVGQSRIEVLKYCGEPQDRLAYLDERVTHTRLSTFQQGMTQFTRSTGSYVETSRDTVTSAPAVDRAQNSKTGGIITLPQTHQHDETRVAQNNTETAVGSYVTLSTFWECKKVSVYIDEYVYNFGAGKFLTFVRFENGRVRGIKYGEYGF